MALTLSIRQATNDDADVCIAGAATAGDDAWTKYTVQSRLADPASRIFLVIADWPERSLTQRPVAMVAGTSYKGALYVTHLAIDPSLVPPNFIAERRRIADRAVIRAIQFAQNRGLTLGWARNIPRNTAISAYIDSITGVSKIASVVTNKDDYSMDLSQALTFLQNRSPS